MTRPDEHPFDGRARMRRTKNIEGFHSHILLEATWLCQGAKSLQLWPAKPQQALAADDLGKLRSCFKDLQRLSELVEEPPDGVHWVRPSSEALERCLNKPDVFPNSIIAPLRADQPVKEAPQA